MEQFGISTQVSVAVFAPLAVGAVFTFLSIWISGRNNRNNTHIQNDLASKLKLVDFRQHWINQLRDSFAEFQGRALTSTNTPEELREIHRLAAKLRLLMNRTDKHYNDLSGLIGVLVLNTDPAGRSKLVNDLTPLLQSVLKAEWEVLKSDLRYVKSSDPTNSL